MKKLIKRHDEARLMDTNTNGKLLLNAEISKEVAVKFGRYLLKEAAHHWDKDATVRIMKPKYLVRPKDFSIHDLDESNGCYRGWSKKPTTYSDGTRPNAMAHFTFENLTKNYGFFAIEESEIETYEQKCDEYYKFLSWQSRSDGHGGSKGGTYEEYLKVRR